MYMPCANNKQNPPSDIRNPPTKNPNPPTENPIADIVFPIAGLERTSPLLNTSEGLKNQTLQPILL